MDTGTTHYCFQCQTSKIFVSAISSVTETNTRTKINAIFTLQLWQNSTNPCQVADVELEAAAMMAVRRVVVVLTTVAVCLLRRQMLLRGHLRRPVAVFRLRRCSDHVVVQIHVFTAEFILKKMPHKPTEYSPQYAIHNCRTTIKLHQQMFIAVNVKINNFN